MVDQEEFQNISNIINPTKNTKIIHYTSVLKGDMNYRLRKAKFKSFRILLNCRASWSIIISEHIQKLWKKVTKSFCLITQRCNFNTSPKSKADIVLPKLDVTKIIT